MLVDFQSEVVDIFVAVSHPFEPLDFIVDTFRDSRTNFLSEPVYNVLELIQETFCYLLKHIKRALYGVLNPAAEIFFSFNRIVLPRLFQITAFSSVSTTLVK